MKPTPQRQLWGIVLAAGEGTRVREFLAQLCGGRGIKQFCAVTGRRSMLQHTLCRTEQLIPRERIFVVVSADHRAERACEGPQRVALVCTQPEHNTRLTSIQWGRRKDLLVSTAPSLLAPVFL